MTDTSNPANAPATPPSPPVPPAAQPSWLRRYWIPVAIGGAAAWVVSVPILAGGALGAGARYVYEKYKATK